MTANQIARVDIKARLETRDSGAQAAAEGAALRGELGVDAQLLAMSEQYKALKAAGQHDAARAIKVRAIEIDAARER